MKIPGIGVHSAKRIYKSRQYFKLQFQDLKKMGVVLKRAQYFITCNGKYFLNPELFEKNFIETNLINIPSKKESMAHSQLTLFHE